LEGEAPKLKSGNGATNREARAGKDIEERAIRNAKRAEIADSEACPDIES
jgi:hypothetical protein